MTVSILLADDHEIFRQGLEMLLGSQSDFIVIGQAKDGLEAVMLAEQLQPEVVVIDMLMPGLNGMDATVQIKQRSSGTKVIILSMHDDESYVLSALQNGACGYVLKESSTADLIQAVRSAISGQRFLSPSLSQRAIDVYINYAQKQLTEAYTDLTSREKEVFHLSAEGLNNAQIADRLYLSVRTVETHRSNMMHKLGLHTQADLINYARQHKVIPFE
jgi:two-component system, NarL family, response regulator NreC